MKELYILLMSFQGYLELGMDQEAIDVLEDLPHDAKVHPAVLLCQFDLLIHKKKWEEGVILGQSLCDRWPGKGEFWFRTAFCLHELRRTIEARQVLLNAPKTLRQIPVYSYNLACYEAQLGDLLAAKHCSKSAFRRHQK